MATTDLITLAEAKIHLSISTSDLSQDDRLSALITGCSARILDYLQTNVVIQDRTEYHYGGKKRIYLQRYPIVSGPSQIIDGAGFVVPDTYYVTIHEQGILQSVGLWPIAQEANGARSRWKITYSAGLVVNTASVPADLKQACLFLVAMHLNRPDQSVTMKAVGDLRLSYRDAAASEQAYGFPPEVAALLSPYMSQGF